MLHSVRASEAGLTVVHAQADVDCYPGTLLRALLVMQKGGHKSAHPLLRQCLDARGPGAWLLGAASIRRTQATQLREQLELLPLP